MSKTYELAPEEVSSRAGRLIEKYHKDLENSGAKIDYIYARATEGHAVTHGGYPALAVIKIISLKDRAAGRGDAEITIDADAYEGMSGERRDGLLDHELYHLIVRRDDDGFVKMDDLDRPMFKMRKHDWQMGWFTEIAQRHGLNSVEVSQAQILWANDGQAYFPMLLECSTPAKKGNPLAELAETNLDSVEISDGKRTVTFAKGGNKGSFKKKADEFVQGVVDGLNKKGDKAS